MVSIVSSSDRQTRKVGRELAKHLKGGEILALFGALGSGKTTFVKGLAAGLGIGQKITSPSFLAARRYRARGKWLHHFDLYRLRRGRELSEFGFEEIIRDPKNIVIIEWPEKARLPKRAIGIKFQYGENKHRRIIKLNL